MWPLRRAYQISPKKYLLQVSVLLGFLTTIPLARSQNHGTLRGIISSRFGVMSDVLVSLSSTDRVLQIKSDSNGRFEFADAPSGTYELEASIAAFQTQKVDSVRIPEKGVETIAINLLIANQPSDCGRGLSAAYEKAASLKPALIGIVRGYPGGPLAGFKIRLWKEHGTKALASQRSNEKGEFEFRDIEPGRYVVRASHKGNWMAQSEIFWMTHENTTRITLDPFKRGGVIICQ